MELFKASRQWAERPEDERFWTLQEMSAACKDYYNHSLASTVLYGDLKTDVQGVDIALVGKNGNTARLTNYAFGQLCQRVHAPASYLRTLPPTLAVENLNHGLTTQRDKTDKGALLLHKNGDLIARCITGVKYQRIWNWEIADRLIKLQEAGWKVPPARPSHKIKNPKLIRTATEADVLSTGKLGLSVKVGDQIGPAGIYASDRDMFVFMVDDEHVLDNPACPGIPLAKGFFMWNSEVGDASFGICAFLYDAVCGNHIVWGAQQVREFRIRHIGDARDRAFWQIKIELKEYAEESTSDLQAKIKKAQSYVLGTDKDEVLDAILKFARGKRLNTITESVAEEAMDLAESTTRYGNPRTAWAVAQGMTELSQRSNYASTRVEMDRDAGRLMEIAF